MKHFIFTLTFLLFATSVVAQEKQHQINQKPLLKKGEIRWLEKQGFKEYDWSDPTVNLLLNQALQKRKLGNGLLYGMLPFPILGFIVAAIYPPLILGLLILGPVTQPGVVWGAIERISANKKLHLAKVISVVKK